MDEVWAAKRFVKGKLAAIPNIAALAPAGIHEDEVPDGADPGKVAVVYQIETANEVLYGMGAVVVWQPINVLIDVIVPGKSQAPGEALTRAIRSAFHGATGTVTNGAISSCVYAGALPPVPEHDANSGADFEHLYQRFRLHARGT